MQIKDIVYCALFAALTATIGLFPPFPLPFIGIPITLQNMAPWLAGAIIGAKRGFFSQVLFIFLVLLGLPLLSGGRGGLGILVGPTAGFMLTWPLSAYIIGALTEKYWHQITVKKWFIFVFFGGLAISNIMGIPWMAFILHLTFIQALLSSLIFLPGDLVKTGIAASLAMSVKRCYPLIHISENIIKNK